MALISKDEFVDVMDELDVPYSETQSPGGGYAFAIWSKDRGGLHEDASLYISVTDTGAIAIFGIEQEYTNGSALLAVCRNLFDFQDWIVNEMDKHR